MRSLLLSVAAFIMGGFILAQDAAAHGGNFKGPSGGVPPGLREPSDPEPPPPPPSDPGDPGGPTTPTDPEPDNPTTPDDLTPGGNDAPPPPTPTGPSTERKRPSTKTLSFDSWRFWWAYNNEDILKLKENIYSQRTSSSSAMHFATRRDAQNRQNPQRLTAQKVKQDIIPALEKRLDDKADNEDVHGGALVAIGKLGNADHIGLLRDAMYNQMRNSRGQHVDLGPLATESAAIALGLLENLDASGKKAVREICLQAITTAKKLTAKGRDLRNRERSWAAVSLGLQKDAEAIPAMAKLLQKKYSKESIPAGILAGIGLVGRPDVEVEGGTIGAVLTKAFKEKKLFNRSLSDRVQSFVGYSLLKMKYVEALPNVLSVLKSRRHGVFSKRTAAIAAGVLAAASNDDAVKADAVKKILSFIRKTSDKLAANFATIALSQIGTPKAIDYLIERVDKGTYLEKPYAAVGLGTYVWYQEQAGTMDPNQKKKIVARLQKVSRKGSDADTKAALFLARGLVQDHSVSEELLDIAGSKSKNPVLRGFCCVALGLLGDARQEVKDVLEIALAERKSEDMRRDAATALGLLHDANVVKTLLKALDKAKSMTVQGQIINALGQIGDHEAVQPLMEILENKSKPTVTRAMASVGLGLIGDLRPLPKLSLISKNYNWRASVPDIDFLLDIL